MLLRKKYLIIACILLFNITIKTQMLSQTLDDLGSVIHALGLIYDNNTSKIPAEKRECSEFFNRLTSFLKSFEPSEPTPFCKIGSLAGQYPSEIARVIFALKKADINSHPYQNTILLYGPPGTGKTVLAKTIAQESGAVFIRISASSVVDSWQGGGAENIRKIYAIAKEELKNKKKVIVFIDEIDAFAKSRKTSTNNQERENALDELMIKLVNYEDNPMIVTNHQIQCPNKFLMPLILVKQAKNIIDMFFWVRRKMDVDQDYILPETILKS